MMAAFQKHANSGDMSNRIYKEIMSIPGHRLYGNKRVSSANGVNSTQVSFTSPRNSARSSMKTSQNINYEVYSDFDIIKSRSWSGSKLKGSNLANSSAPGKVDSQPCSVSGFPAPFKSSVPQSLAPDRSSVASPGLPAGRRLQSPRVVLASQSNSLAVADNKGRLPQHSTAKGSQVERLHQEWAALDHCRAMKRASEMVQHRMDPMYQLSGSNLPLLQRYHVDESELQRLRDMAETSRILQTDLKRIEVSAPEAPANSVKDDTCLMMSSPNMSLQCHSINLLDRAAGVSMLFENSANPSRGGSTRAAISDFMYSLYNDLEADDDMSEVTKESVGQKGGSAADSCVQGKAESGMEGDGSETKQVAQGKLSNLGIFPTKHAITSLPVSEPATFVQSDSSMTMMQPVSDGSLTHPDNLKTSKHSICGKTLTNPHIPKTSTHPVGAKTLKHPDSLKTSRHHVSAKTLTHPDSPKTSTYPVSAKTLTHPGSPKTSMYSVGAKTLTHPDTPKTLRRPVSGKTLTHHDSPKNSKHPVSAKHLTHPDSPKTSRHPVSAKTLTHHDSPKNSRHPVSDKTLIHPDSPKTSRHPVSVKNLTHPDKHKTSRQSEKACTVTHSDSAKTFTHSDSANSVTYSHKAKALTHPDCAKTFTHSDKAKTVTHSDKAKTLMSPHSDSNKTSVYPENTKNSEHLDDDKILSHLESGQTSKYSESRETSAHPEGGGTSSQAGCDEFYVILSESGKTSVHPDSEKTSINTNSVKTSSYPDSGKTLVHPDNGKISVYPDSGKTSLHLDSGKTSVHPDDGETSIHPDSGWISLHLDSGKTSVHPDNSDISIHPDSGKISSHPDNGKTSIIPNSGKTSVHPDNGKTSAHPDSGKTSVHPDSGKTSVHPDNGKTSVHPDSEKTSIHPDSGKTSSHPGSFNISIHPDSGKTSVYPNNGKTSVYPNSEMNLGYPDSSKTVIHPDSGKSFTHPNSDRTSTYLADDDRTSVYPNNDWTLTQSNTDRTLTQTERPRVSDQLNRDTSLTQLDCSKTVTRPSSEKLIPSLTRTTFEPDGGRTMTPPQIMQQVKRRSRSREMANNYCQSNKRTSIQWLVTNVIGTEASVEPVSNTETEMTLNDTEVQAAVQICQSLTSLANKEDVSHDNEQNTTMTILTENEKEEPSGGKKKWLANVERDANLMPSTEMLEEERQQKLLVIERNFEDDKNGESCLEKSSDKTCSSSSGRDCSSYSEEDYLFSILKSSGVLQSVAPKSEQACSAKQRNNDWKRPKDFQDTLVDIGDDDSLINLGKTFLKKALTSDQHYEVFQRTSPPSPRRRFGITLPASQSADQREWPGIKAFQLERVTSQFVPSHSVLKQSSRKFYESTDSSVSPLPQFNKGSTSQSNEKSVPQPGESELKKTSTSKDETVQVFSKGPFSTPAKSSKTLTKYRVNKFHSAGKKVGCDNQQVDQLSSQRRLAYTHREPKVNHVMSSASSTGGQSIPHRSSGHLRVTLTGRSAKLLTRPSTAKSSTSEYSSLTTSTTEKFLQGMYDQLNMEPRNTVSNFSNRSHQTRDRVSQVGGKQGNSKTFSADNFKGKRKNKPKLSFKPTVKKRKGQAIVESVPALVPKCNSSCESLPLSSDEMTSGDGDEEVMMSDGSLDVLCSLQGDIRSKYQPFISSWKVKKSRASSNSFSLPNLGICSQQLEMPQTRAGLTRSWVQEGGHIMVTHLIFNHSEPNIEKQHQQSLAGAKHRRCLKPARDRVRFRPAAPSISSSSSSSSRGHVHRADGHCHLSDISKVASVESDIVRDVSSPPASEGFGAQSQSSLLKEECFSVAHSFNHKVDSIISRWQQKLHCDVPVVGGSELINPDFEQKTNLHDLKNKTDEVVCIQQQHSTCDLLVVGKSKIVKTVDQLEHKTGEADDIKQEGGTCLTTICSPEIGSTVRETDIESCVHSMGDNYMNNEDTSFKRPVLNTGNITVHNIRCTADEQAVPNTGDTSNIQTTYNSEDSSKARNVSATEGTSTNRPVHNKIEDNDTVNSMFIIEFSQNTQTVHDFENTSNARNLRSFEGACAKNAVHNPKDVISNQLHEDSSDTKIVCNILNTSNIQRDHSMKVTRNCQTFDNTDVFSNTRSLQRVEDTSLQMAVCNPVKSGKTQNVHNTEDTSNTQDLLNTEDTSNTHDLLNTEDTSNTQDLLNTKDTRNILELLNIEDTSNTQDLLNTEDTSYTQDPLNTKDTSDAQNLLNTKDTSNKQDLLNTEDTSNTQDLLNTKDISNTKDLLNTEDTSNTQDPLNTKDTSDTQNLLNTKNTCDTQDLLNTKDTSNTQDLLNNKDTSYTQDLLNTEDTSNTQDLLNTKDISNTQDLLNTKNTCDTQDLLNTKDTSNTQDLLTTKDTSNTQDLLNTEDTSNTQDLLNTKDISNTQDLLNTKNTCDTQDLLNTKDTSNTQDLLTPEDTGNTQDLLTTENTSNTQNVHDTEDTRINKYVPNTKHVRFAQPEDSSLPGADSVCTVQYLPKWSQSASSGHLAGPHAFCADTRTWMKTSSLQRKPTADSPQNDSVASGKEHPGPGSSTSEQLNVCFNFLQIASIADQPKSAVQMQTSTKTEPALKSGLRVMQPKRSTPPLACIQLTGKGEQKKMPVSSISAYILAKSSFLRKLAMAEEKSDLAKPSCQKELLSHELTQPKVKTTSHSAVDCSTVVFKLSTRDGIMEHSTKGLECKSGNSTPMKSSARPASAEDKSPLSVYSQNTQDHTKGSSAQQKPGANVYCQNNKTKKGTATTLQKMDTKANTKESSAQTILQKILKKTSAEKLHVAIQQENTFQTASHQDHTEQATKTNIKQAFVQINSHKKAPRNMSAKKHEITLRANTSQTTSSEDLKTDIKEPLVQNNSQQSPKKMSAKKLNVITFIRNSSPKSSSLQKTFKKLSVAVLQQNKKQLTSQNHTKQATEANTKETLLCSQENPKTPLRTTYLQPHEKHSSSCSPTSSKENTLPHETSTTSSSDPQYQLANSVAHNSADAKSIHCIEKARSCPQQKTLASSSVMSSVHSSTLPSTSQTRSVQTQAIQWNNHWTNSSSKAFYTTTECTWRPSSAGQVTLPGSVHSTAPVQRQRGWSATVPEGKMRSALGDNSFRSTMSSKITTTATSSSQHMPSSPRHKTRRRKELSVQGDDRKTVEVKKTAQAPVQRQRAWSATVLEGKMRSALGDNSFRSTMSSKITTTATSSSQHMPSSPRHKTRRRKELSVQGDDRKTVEVKKTAQAPVQRQRAWSATVLEGKMRSALGDNSFRSTMSSKITTTATSSSQHMPSSPRHKTRRRKELSVQGDDRKTVEVKKTAQAPVQRQRAWSATVLEGKMRSALDDHSFRSTMSSKITTTATSSSQHMPSSPRHKDRKRKELSVQGDDRKTVEVKKTAQAPVQRQRAWSATVLEGKMRSALGDNSFRSTMSSKITTTATSSSQHMPSSPRHKTRRRKELSVQGDDRKTVEVKKTAQAPVQRQRAWSATVLEGKMRSALDDHSFRSTTSSKITTTATSSSQHMPSSPRHKDRKRKELSVQGDDRKTVEDKKTAQAEKTADNGEIVQLRKLAEVDRIANDSGIAHDRYQSWTERTASYGGMAKGRKHSKEKKKQEELMAHGESVAKNEKMACVGKKVRFSKTNQDQRVAGVDSASPKRAKSSSSQAESISDASGKWRSIKAQKALSSRAAGTKSEISLSPMNQMSSSRPKSAPSSSTLSTSCKKCRRWGKKVKANKVTTHSSETDQLANTTGKCSQTGITKSVPSQHTRHAQMDKKVTVKEDKNCLSNQEISVPKVSKSSTDSAGKLNRSFTITKVDKHTVCSSDRVLVSHENQDSGLRNKHHHTHKRKQKGRNLLNQRQHGRGGYQKHHQQMSSEDPETLISIEVKKQGKAEQENRHVDFARDVGESGSGNINSGKNIEIWPGDTEFSCNIPVAEHSSDINPLMDEYKRDDCAEGWDFKAWTNPHGLKQDNAWMQEQCMDDCQYGHNSDRVNRQAGVFSQCKEAYRHRRLQNENRVIRQDSGYYKHIEDIVSQVELDSRCHKEVDEILIQMGKESRDHEQAEEIHTQLGQYSRNCKQTEVLTQFEQDRRNDRYTSESHTQIRQDNSDYLSTVGESAHMHSKSMHFCEQVEPYPNRSQNARSVPTESLSRCSKKRVRPKTSQGQIFTSSENHPLTVTITISDCSGEKFTGGESSCLLSRQPQGSQANPALPMHHGSFQDVLHPSTTTRYYTDQEVAELFPPQFWHSTRRPSSSPRRTQFKSNFTNEVVQQLLSVGANEGTVSSTSGDESGGSPSASSSTSCCQGENLSSCNRPCLPHGARPGSKDCVMCLAASGLPLPRHMYPVEIQPTLHFLPVNPVDDRCSNMHSAGDIPPAVSHSTSSASWPWAIRPRVFKRQSSDPDHEEVTPSYSIQTPMMSCFHEVEAFTIPSSSVPRQIFSEDAAVISGTTEGCFVPAKFYDPCWYWKGQALPPKKLSSASRAHLIRPYSAPVKPSGSEREQKTSSHDQQWWNSSELSNRQSSYAPPDLFVVGNTIKPGPVKQSSVQIEINKHKHCVNRT